MATGPCPGIRIDLGPDGVKHCLEKIGIGFMFAPLFHPAMKHAVTPRREIGIRTVFNILGPLTNPAGAQAQVIGVAEENLAPKMAQALQHLGCHHAIIAHSEDGLDEISISSKTRIWELKENTISTYTVAPEELGFQRVGIEEIKGDTAGENAAMLRAVLEGEKSARRDVVLFNAAAALVAGKLARDLGRGVEIAREAIDSGNASHKLEELIQMSQGLATK